MTRPPRPEPRVLLARYAPFIALMLVVAITGALLAARDKSTTGSAGLATAPTIELPLTPASAREAGRQVDFGEHCDTTTGRVKLPTVYAPPCAEPLAPGADNGGTTWQGVTDDEIVVAVYLAPNDPLTTGMISLSGAKPDPAKDMATVQGYIDLFTSQINTYGRKIRLVKFEGAGAGDDDVAAKADAIKVATEIKAFASFGGPFQTNAYAAELAARGVVCIQCSLVMTDDLAQKYPGLIWGYQMSPEQLVQALISWMAKGVSDRPAEFAGDPKIQTQTRKVGVVNYDTKDGTFRARRETFQNLMRAAGVDPKSLAVQLSYNLDLARGQEIARTIIAKLKEAKVTTVIVIGDPIMPRFFTQEATAQDYFPEWIVTGTVLTDTTAVARNLYDPKQWGHAFGISGLPVRTDQFAQAPGYLYLWFHGEEPPSTAFQLAFPAPFIFSLGIHLAGPELTPETFKAALFSYPASGSSLLHPQLSFGENGIFEATDYFGFDDSVEIWFDATEVSNSEIGDEGTGSYRYSRGGQRFLRNEWPDEPSRAFDTTDAPAFLDATEEPRDEWAPRYPSPLGPQVDQMLKQYELPAASGS